MTDYWELKLWGLAVGVTFGWLVVAVLRAWWHDRQQWKRVPRHFGTTYDASSRDARPNVDLRRLR